MIDASRAPSSWNRFKAGLDGSAWYLHSLHSQLRRLLPESRSVRQLGECVETILASEAVRQRLRHGMSAQEWVEGYLERPETHPRS